MKDNVTFHGFVPDAVLDRALSRTDLAINLRYPTMGESSLSQLRIWAHSLPSVVTRDGWYAELEDDVVDFVRPDHEIDDLQAVLRRLLVDPAHFESQRLRGHERLKVVHDPERYARELVSFAETLL
jgi:glycosyltransferase involved in cell wall biosynthesis